MNGIATRVARCTGVVLLASFLLAFPTPASSQGGGDVFGVQTEDGNARAKELRAKEKDCQERKKENLRRLNERLVDQCHPIQDGTAREGCKRQASAAFAAEARRINAECALAAKPTTGGPGIGGGGGPAGHPPYRGRVSVPPETGSPTGSASRRPSSERPPKPAGAGSPDEGGGPAGHPPLRGRVSVPPETGSPTGDGPGEVKKTDQSKQADQGRSPGPCNLRNLRELAALVFKQYGLARPPIAIYRVTNRQQPTYLVLLQGLEEGVVGAYEATQAWLAGAHKPQFLMAYYVRQLAHGEDTYKAAILDAVRGLPREATPITLILSGHSAGGIEAQNLAPELARQGFHVEHVVTFGSPITVVPRLGGTRYLYVKGKTDLIAWLDHVVNITDTLKIQGGHSIYEKSSELESHQITPCFQVTLHSTHGIEKPGESTGARAAEPDCPPALGVAAVPARAPPQGPPGSPSNPLRGQDIREYAKEGNGKTLVGHTIELAPVGQGLPPRRLTLGKHYGKGVYGSVYAIDSANGQRAPADSPPMVIKIIHQEGGDVSVVRQKRGHDLLKASRVPTPDIVICHRGDGREPAYLVMPDLERGGWNGRKAEPGDMWVTKEQQTAMTQLYQEIGRGGNVWIDGHPGNVFYFRDNAGKWRAGVLDPDFIYPARQGLLAQDFGTQHAANELYLGEAFKDTGGPTAMVLMTSSPPAPATVTMTAIWNARFVNQPQQKGAKAP